MLGHELLGRGRARRARLRARRSRHRDRPPLVRPLRRVRRGRARRLRHGRLPRARHHAAARVRRASSSPRRPSTSSPVPPSLGRLGVLAEPASICERGLRHVRAVGDRQPWSPRRALVLGAGAIGMLGTYLLRMDGLEVWTASRTARRRARAAGRGLRRAPRGDRRDAAARRWPRRSAASTSCSRRPATRSSCSTRSGCCAATAWPACSASTAARARCQHRRPRAGRRRDPPEPRALRQRERATAWTGTRRWRTSTRRGARWPEALEAFVGLRVPLDCVRGRVRLPRREGDAPAGMRYLVTGALGAIGAWTVRALLDRGHEVVTYDLGGSDHRLRLALSDDELAALTRVDGDVTDLAAARGASSTSHDIDGRDPPRRAAGAVRPRRPGRPARA